MHSTDKSQSINAQPLSVIVPVRIDVSDRLENLRTITAYLRRYFLDAELILVECDAEPHVPQDIKEFFDITLFIRSDGPFAKSHSMNEGLTRATRSVVAFYDVDVLVYPSSAAWAISKIQNQKFPIALPFNGVFVDIDGERRAQAMKELSVGDLADLSTQAIRLLSDCTTRVVDGGVFFADRKVMLAEGGFNKKMISYGWEDIEVLRRFEKLGYYHAYALQNLVHLNHARGPDSVKNEHYDNNREEYKNICNKSKAELQTYVSDQLAILPREEAEILQNYVRIQWSRRFGGVTHALATMSKILSRFRHRFRHIDKKSFSRLVRY